MLRFHLTLATSNLLILPPAKCPLFWE